VKFAGFLNQSEIIKAYVAADVLVLPSDGGETWGLVVNEAMACGLPCIVSDQVGCGPDLVTRDTGAIFRLGDVQQLATRMSDFAADRIALQKRGKAAAQKINEYSTEVAVNGVLQAVAAVTENRR
jgi:glycosyltransferase involved in cell wall biosynthesis